MIVSLPITGVRVFEDRAQVTRSGSVELDPGSTTVTIEGVSPLIVERTVEASPAGSVTVAQIRTRRWLDTTRIDRFAADPELQQAYLDAADRVRVCTSDCANREHQISQYAALRTLSLKELALAANESLLDGPDAGRSLASLRDGERAARIGLVGAQAELRDAQRELADLEARMRAAAVVADQWRAAVDIELQRDDAGAADLEVRYVVPNAAWRPAHVATRSDDGSSVSVRSEAVVWQATDESWEGVQLVLSTARTTKATDPPPVEDDILHLIETGKEIEIEWREVDEHLGEGATFGELPAVDDGGDPQLLTAEGAVDVPADGLPTRVPIGSFTADARSDLVCRPAIERAAHRRSRQVNGSARPLLAGPVLLVEDGGVTGWTTIGYVGAGEQFELGWGPEIAIAVDRRAESKDDESITGATSTEHRVTASLRNNGATAHDVEVVERVPVSEIDRVSIKVDETAPSARPDDDGLLHWQLSLPPDGEAREVALTYTIKKHRTVSS